MTQQDKPIKPTQDAHDHSKRRVIVRIVCLVLFLAAATALLLPMLGAPRVTPGWMDDIHNLRSIALSSEAYAADHDGQYPPNVRVLLDDGYSFEESFVSYRDPVQTMRTYSGQEPPSDLYQHGSYIFFPMDGIDVERIQDPAQFVLAYSPPYTRGIDGKDHPAVFLDGHAEMLSEDELFDFLALQSAMRESD